MTHNLKSDINILINNINYKLNQYNTDLTIRQRKIDFKNLFYFLIQYNMDPLSSYDNTNIFIYNQDESSDVTYQSYVKKRNNIKIDFINDINTELIKSFYKHISDDNNNNYKFKVNDIYYRLIACDGSQLNFLYSLNKHFKSNKNNTYTHANLSCLFDVNLKVPIDYMISNDDERSMLIKQLKYLNNNDILIADRGYHSDELVKQLDKNKINFVLRISKHTKYYISNKQKIDSSNEGRIDYDNITLHWYKTRNEITNNIEKIETSIQNIKNNLNDSKQTLKQLTNEYDSLFNENKSLILEINKNILNDKKKDNTYYNLKIKKNRILKNTINENKKKVETKIKKLNGELIELYKERKEIELINNSKYLIVTNLKTLDLNKIKEIYKKRWEVETHFRYAKKSFKFDSMYNKNYEYVKQNIQVTKFIFIITSYIQYILNKKINKNKTLNITSLFTSLKNKLIFHLMNDSVRNIDKIISILNKLIKSIIKKITTMNHRERIRKRPQKNHYNSNIR